ncbi:hypothetical protein NEPAR06_0130 [Nematocida parisii]|nr:hypothetical protein NEPAR03_1820 [Nematocida parisii]KAI5153009.1 hypothetical protein NEPAR06_0130 [Nematocida parisii]KAI5157919.1 hypothetical protein NEPAR05_1703 [Nematocida parisii]
MYLKETKVSLAVGTVSLLTSVRFYFCEESHMYRYIQTWLPFISCVLHLMPFFLPFFISMPSRLRRIFNGSMYIISCLLSLIVCGVFIFCKDFNAKSIIAVFAYLAFSLFESTLYLGKWYNRSKKRRELRNKSLVRRRYGSGDIRMPPIGVSTETKHLRAKSDFIYNGTIYIRKGETVELLKVIGSYYSVRTSTGVEYIVPKENFY